MINLRIWNARKGHDTTIRHSLAGSPGGQRRRRRIHAESVGLLLAVAIVTAVVFSLLGFLQPSTVNLTADLVARSIAFDAAPGEPLNFDADIPLTGRAKGNGNADQSGKLARVRVENFQSASPPLAGIGAERDVVLESAALRLTDVTLAGSGSFGLTLSRGSDQLRALVGGGSVTLIGTAAVSVAAGGGKAVPIDSDGPGLVAFRSDPDGRIPLVIESRVNFPTNAADAANALPPLLIEDAAIKRLRFGRENGSASSAAFVSSVESGTVTLVGNKNKLTLERGSPLFLDRFSGTLISLELGRDGLHVIFAGQASHVRLGPPLFDEDVTPTILDVLYHKTWVRLACATVLAIGGGIASLIFILDGEVPVKDHGSRKRSSS